MNVRELIELLQHTQDQDALVCVYELTTGGLQEVRGVVTCESVMDTDGVRVDVSVFDEDGETPPNGDTRAKTIIFEVDQ